MVLALQEKNPKQTWEAKIIPKKQTYTFYHITSLYKKIHKLYLIRDTMYVYDVIKITV